MESLKTKVADRIIYCSSGSKSQNEDGTQANPFKSITSAIENATDGSCIMLERNYTYDCFTSIVRRSISFGAYGTGAKPVINRFIKVQNVNKNLFTKDVNAENIWDINFDKLLSITGKSVDEFSNLGFIYNPFTDKIAYGSRVAFQTGNDVISGFDGQLPDYTNVQAYSWLGNEGDFYQSSDGKIIKVYSSNNPNEPTYPQNYNKPTYGNNPRSISELWFANDGVFMSYPHDCVIRDIKFVGFGRQVFEGVGDNVEIENVDVDLIGGCAFDRANVDTRNFIRIGNAIDIVTTADAPVNNVFIHNTNFSRVFGCATSLSGLFDKYVEYGAENIVVENNVMMNCAALSANIYYQNSSGWVHGTSMVKNCHFRGNKVFFTFYNGFSDSKYLTNFALIYGIPGFKISQNYFYDSNLMLRFTNEFGFDMDYGNMCYMSDDRYLFTEYSNELTEVQYPANPNYIRDTVNRYRQLVYDNHTVFFSIDSESYPPIY